MKIDAFKSVSKLAVAAVACAIAVGGAVSSVWAQPWTVSFDLNGGDGTAPTSITEIDNNDTIPIGSMPDPSGFAMVKSIIAGSTSGTMTGYSNDGKWHTRTGDGVSYSYTEFVFGDTGTPVTSDTTLYLQWEERHTITLNVAVGGTVGTVGGTVSGSIDSTWVTLTATPDTANFYEFVNWTDGDGGVVSTSVTYSFTAISDDTLTANFALKTYTVAVSANPAAGGTVTGADTYEHGDVVTLKARPSTGYNFVNWTVAGTVVGTDTMYTFTAVSDSTLVANFALKEYTITVSANPAAGGTVSGGDTYTHGDDVTVTAVPDTVNGYEFKNWTEGGTSVSASASYTFTATAGRTLVANFALKTYTVSYDLNGGIGTLFSEDFESGTTGWTIVNGSQTNKWVRGTSAYSTGSYSMYITNAASPTTSSSNAYSTTTSTVHFYRDIEFPVSSDNFVMTFDFRGYGYSGYDQVTVRYCDTIYTPLAGSTFSSGSSLGTYNLTSSWTKQTVTLPASAFSGKTMRIVFTWRNSSGYASSNYGPAAAIDNIVIKGVANPSNTTITHGNTIATAPSTTGFFRDNYVHDGKWYTRAVSGTDTTYTPFVFGASGIGTTVISATTLYLKWTPLRTVRFDLNGGMNTVFSEDFEGSTTGWVSSYDYSNRWMIGTGTYRGVSGKSAYVTSNGSSYSQTNSYAINHIYRDITFPTSDDDFVLTFYYRGDGSGSNGLTVRHSATSATPSEGFTFSSGTLLGTTYYGTGTWQQATITLPAATFSGTTRRIVFSWNQQYYYTTTASVAIDDIVINGGTPASITVADSSTLTVAQKPSTEGYTKAGYLPDGDWYTRSISGTDTTFAKFVFGTTKVTADITLYAGWDSAHVVTFDPDNRNILDGFEGGNDGWTIVNGSQTNKWVRGTDTYASGGGTYSMYVTNASSPTASSPNLYSTTTSTVHFYKDITFPVSNTNFVMTFDFRGYGNSYDYMAVSYGTTGYTPSASSLLNSSYWTQLNTFNNSASWSKQTVTLPASAFSGQTRRIVFTWRNSSGWTGYNPPAAIDNITIDGISSGNSAPTSILIKRGTSIPESQVPAATDYIKPGYVNDGKWYARSGDNPSEYEYHEFNTGTNGSPITVDRTLYLKWEPGYRVSFDLNGGAGTVPTRRQVVLPVDTLSVAQKPATTGFTLQGYSNDGKWYIRTVSGMGDTTYTEFVFGAGGTSLTSDITLYLKWSLNGDALVTEGFENATHGWTAVNGTETNGWVIGSGAYSGGVRSAYISDDGTTNAYDTTGASIVHLYKDIKFPECSADFIMTYKFRGNGEADNDVMTIRYSSVDVSAPTAGSVYTSGTILDTVQGHALWTNKHVILPSAAFSGNTMRIIFTWINNDVDGEQTPAAIDDISIRPSSKVVFNLDGGAGTVPASIDTVRYGYTLATKPDTAGITFVGYTNDGEWYTRAGTSPSDYVYTKFVFGAAGVGTPVTSNITLYLKWTPTGGEVFTETFENGTNKWVLSNGSEPNKWMIGTDTKYADLNSAYITNNASTNGYDTFSPSIVHIYKDITFPVSNADYVLKYYFKGNGQQNSVSGNPVDYMIVRYSDTVSVPTAGSVFTAGTLLGTHQGVDEWTEMSAILPASDFSGKTVRLVFTWINDDIAGTQPPAAIDNISISPSINVTFDINGATTIPEGGVPDTIVGIKPGSRLTAAQKPSTEGYTRGIDSLYEGKWYTRTGAGTTASPYVYTEFVFDATTGTVVNTHTTLYLRWEPVYTISYTLNGGTVATDDPTIYSANTNAITLTTPTRTGYTFAGWKGTGIQDSVMNVTIAKGSTGNRSYTACWNLNVYTITFDPMGGEVTPTFGRTDSVTTSYYWTLGTLPTPETRTGYTFDNWYTDSVGGDRVYSSSSTSRTVFTANDTIYARWTLTNYAISYHGVSGASFDSDNPTSYNVETETFTLNNPTMVGYEFKGWSEYNPPYTDLGTEVTIEKGSTGSRSYTANWAAAPTITKQPVGGSMWTTHSFSLSVSADRGTHTSGTISYQWYRNTTASTVGGTAITGATTAKISVKESTPATFYYYAVVTLTNTSVTPSTSGAVVSEVVTLIVEDPPLSIVINDNRDIPDLKVEDAVVVPTVAFAAEFSAGPNPVIRSAGGVKIFRTGKKVQNGTLTVYDAAGNVVRKIDIRDGGVGALRATPSSADGARREVGEWDLRDARGRAVAEGTYLVRGSVKTIDGKREKVSFMVGVR